MLIDHKSKNYFEAFNVGHSDTIKLKYSVETIVNYLNYEGEVKYGEGFVSQKSIGIRSLGDLVLVET